MKTVVPMKDWTEATLTELEAVEGGALAAIIAGGFLLGVGVGFVVGLALAGKL